VPWSEISKKPNFGTSNNSIDFVGVALGATGLLFGGAALLNQNGQLVSALQNVAGTIKLNPSGCSRLDEALQLLGDGTNGITLDPSGSINALTRAFNYSRFTQGVDIGLATMSLSNDQIFWKNGATSNMILRSNALTVLNNQPFTISNANVILSNGKLGIGQSNPSTTLALRGNDYSPGWFAEEVCIGGNTYLSFQNVCGSALALNFDCYCAPVYKSSSSNNNYQIRKGEGILQVRYSSNIPIGSNLNFATSMVWNSNGNVGVKMTNPEYELDVNGTANATSIQEGGSNLITKYSLSNQPTHLFSNNTSNIFTYSNVGIGTSDPSCPLNVVGGSVALLRVSDGTQTIVAGCGSNQPWFGTETNHDFCIVSRNTERIRITTAGNTGINTPVPHKIFSSNKYQYGLE
jgi:hypothetical protein